ncbi:Von Willebrand factor A domain-containing protein 7-like [Oopsacas minuta]|uniref:von Willebrand factor A domain-containing protein 7-like n=1 Tax=Oopsacas minuta TaxID=111878 RepID=A0AAV7K406_9METZ|nr:Von Willebrand factor A domain-containing protein 7-like [Oopsacas minuta]
MVITAVQLEQYEDAREQAGQMLHTLQDFYSHTNWVEMGKTEPYTVLGRTDQNPDIVVPEAKSTCINCVEDGEVNFLLSLFGAMYYYICNNNMIAEVNEAGELTSGFYGGQMDEDGEVIEKPDGKCSHGGFLDSSSDLPATGGINKDSIVEEFSPHGDLHFQAVTFAISASEIILNEIRKEVNNDTKFASFLNIDLVKHKIASIAYVIDTTGSMSEELPEIQATLPQIERQILRYKESIGENAEVNLILVPFNDPDGGVIVQTTDVDEFLNSIALLTANGGGGDCPEPSVGATIRAILASEPGSPVFVFTDADASDEYRQTEILALISDTRVTVSYILTAGCSRRKRSENGQSDHIDHEQRRRRSTPSDLYSYIAAFSGGQVLTVDTDSISELSSIIFLSSDRSFTQILHNSGTTITLNGLSITNTIRAPDGTELLSLDPTAISVDLDTSASFIATVNISNSSLNGLWELEFYSSGTYSIQVSGLSTLKLSYQLYQLDLESNFGFSILEAKPTPGETLILLITTSGEYEGIELINMDLITSNGSVQQQFNLTKLGEDSYGSKFIPTSDMLQVGITGVDSNGITIRRVSATSVQVSDIDLRLAEGSYRYNSLYPGNSSNITLVLSNFGDPATFDINVSHNNINSTFSYDSNQTSIYLNQNATKDIILEVTASGNATNGNSIKFIVTASTGSGTDERSNYVSFLFIASTLPPPEFTENIIAAAVKESVSVLLLIFILLANISLQLF